MVNKSASALTMREPGGETVKHLTIAQKLMIGISVCMILIVGGATAIQYRLFSDLITDRVTRAELPATLESIRNDIEATLTGPITTAQSLANNGYLHEWLAEGESRADGERAVNHFEQLQQRTGADTVFYVSALSGNYYTADGIERTLNRERDPWFYHLVDDAGSPDYTLDVDSDEGELKVFINHVVELDGERVGVAGVGYTLDAMAETISNYQLGATGSVFLASQDGIISVHPEGASMAGQPVANLPGWETQADELLSGDGYRYATITDEHGAEQLVAAIEVPGTDWIAFARIPRSELFADLNRAVLLVILIVAVIMLASLVVFALLLRALFRPIRRTAEAMREIAEGDGDLTLAHARMKRANSPSSSTPSPTRCMTCSPRSGAAVTPFGMPPKRSPAAGRTCRDAPTRRRPACSRPRPRWSRSPARWKTPRPPHAKRATSRNPLPSSPRAPATRYRMW